MSNTKNIVVGIDFSKSSVEVLKRAFQISELKNAELTIVHAIDKSLFNMYFSNSNNEEFINKAKEKIEEEIKKLEKNSVNYSIIVNIASPSTLLIEVAKDIHANLVIIGVNEETNFKSKIFGSTSIKTIQNTKLPVLIVKNNCTKEYKDILSFSDLSPISAKSINFAKSFFENSSIKVIHAYKQLNDFVLTFYNSLEEKEKIQTKVIEKAKKEFEDFKKENNIINSELIEVYHGINEVLLNKSNDENKDLIVIGSNGVNDTGSFLYGSTALYMIENVKSDILIYIPND